VRFLSRPIVLLLALLVLVAVAAVTILALHHSPFGVQVTVTPEASLPAVPAQALGINTATWDDALLDPAVPDLLRRAGITMLRFPGGSTADEYDWQTNTMGLGTGRSTGAVSFDAFMGLVRQIGGQAMITVNYGSNAAGTGGGDPAEAASWVRYANSSKGYGIRYWEIGNETYGSWETNLHADHSPAAYATNALAYIKAMKAVDSSIQIGVPLLLAQPGMEAQASAWNTPVLAGTCGKIDFVVVHWYPQEPGQESDSGLLAAPAQIAGMVATLRGQITRACGSAETHLPILLTESNSVSNKPGKQTVSIINALFLADSFATWLEQGITTVDWWDLHNGVTLGTNNAASLTGTATYGDYGILSTGMCVQGVCPPSRDTPFPTYYALQLLSEVLRPGSQLLAASSTSEKVGAHATRQADGRVAILLVNKDSLHQSIALSLHVPIPASTAIISTYAPGDRAPSTTTRTGFGSHFTLTLPGYSLTTIAFASS
jgi:hypothetical protein